MNKQQLYTFGGALLASTALSGAANALTWGKLASDNLTFTTTSYSIANTVFSTTASTANAITITPGNLRVAARFSNTYAVTNTSGTRFSIEVTPTGMTFSAGTATLANANFLLIPSGNSTTFGTTLGANRACGSVIGFGTQFVIDGCTAAATAGIGVGNRSANLGGILFSGVTFTNASGLATAGSTATLTGRLYNTATSANFEAAATGTILTSVAPLTVAVTTPATVTVSASTTPLAFTGLATTNVATTTSTLTMDLVIVTVTANGALGMDMSSLATPATELTSARVSVTSSLLSSGALSTAHLRHSGGQLNQTTVANFSGGTVTFSLTAAQASGSFTVGIAFNGTSQIPAASTGSSSVVFGGQDGRQAPATVTGGAASANQGGFRGEVNTFNASTNGPYSSYLRIHNNGGVAGTVSITIRNDSHDSGAVLGSAFSTAAIQPGSTMQLSAAEMEGTTTSTKLPSGGANVPEASRMGSYTVSVTGPIVGYVQHILFDGQNVADLSSFRNGGVTSNNAAP